MKIKTDIVIANSFFDFNNPNFSKLICPDLENGLWSYMNYVDVVRNSSLFPLNYPSMKVLTEVYKTEEEFLTATKRDSIWGRFSNEHYIVLNYN